MRTPEQRTGRSWKSEIVSDDKGSYMLTWLSDAHAGTADGQGFEIALAKLDAPDAGCRFRMWGMYPVSIGTGFLMALAFACSGADQAPDETGFDVANMLHNRNAAFDASKHAGFPAGEVQAALPHPLRSVRSWKSEIVSDNGGSYMLTWLSEAHAGTAEEQGFETALAKLDAPDAGRRF